MEIAYFTFYASDNSRYREHEKLPNMIKILSNLFGEYPFIKEKYGHAEFPWSGGMEHQTCSSMGSFNESIIIHELAHQWWGDMVTCEDFHNIWLNEGFATYSVALYTEIVYGKNEFQSLMNSTKFFGPGTIYVNDLFDMSAIFSSYLSYDKASWVLHMLRHVVGDDTFFNILKEYYNSGHKFGNINTKSFQDICEKVSGIKLDWFFEQWIFGEYYPQYSVSYKSQNYSDSTHIELTINQKQDKYLFKMPIDININTSNGDTIITIFDSLWAQTFSFTVLGQLQNIELDKGEWILKQVEYIPFYTETPDEPVKYELLQNYPNPFNPSTTIKFSLQKKEHTTLKVFDIMGKEITTLIDNEMNQETHPVVFDLKTLPIELSSGIYFYTLKAGSYIETKKMMLLK
jgi:aminopeptidase N